MNLNYTIQLNLDTEWVMGKHHFHEYYEIIFFLSNAGKCFAGKNMYPIERGSLLIMSDTVLHRTIVDKATAYQRYVLHFSEDTLKSISTPQTDLHAKFKEMNHFIKLDEERIDEFFELFKSCEYPKTNFFGDDLKRGAAFIKLLLRICELIENQPSAEVSTNTNFMKVSPIIEYIQNNLEEDLTLDSIAKKFYMSKYYLCHTFKSSTGFSVGEFIISNRILTARSLLRDGCSVQEAGEKSGFKNNAHFIHTFGKLSGKSPGRYKKENLEGNKK